MKTIITGGSSGIGLKLCEELLNESKVNKVFVVDTKRPPKKNYIIKNNNFKFFKCDISSWKESEKVFKKLVSPIDNLDSLVCCAGINILGSIVDLSPNDWNKVINTNLNGTFYWCKLFSNFIKNKHKGGTIVTIGSIASQFGFEGRSAYTSSKTGINGLTKVLSTELAQYNIRVNCVSPGFTETPLLEEKIKEGIINTKLMLKQNAIKRIAKPSEICALIKFLLKNDSSYITGQNIFVDGGFINKKME